MEVFVFILFLRTRIARCVRHAFVGSSCLDWAFSGWWGQFRLRTPGAIHKTTRPATTISERVQLKDICSKEKEKNTVEKKDVSKA